VVVDVSEERMTLTAGNRKVADWPLGEVDVASQSDGFHIRVDNEEVVLNVTDPTRFATELGVARRGPSRLAGPVGDRTDGAMRERELVASQGTSSTVIPNRGPTETTPNELWADEVKRRISDIAVALTSDLVSPAEAFGHWLRLLKEINRRHGQGSMSSDLFFQVNTQLLDLIPDPPRTPDSTGRS